MSRTERPLKSGTSEKYRQLEALLRGMGKVLVAFSGGVDSTLLLRVAHDVLGDGVLAVIGRSPTFPDSEETAAVKLAEAMGVSFRLIETCEMEDPNFVSNPPERCYYCKKELFSQLGKIASEEGIPHVLDGENYEDTGDFRPGSRAAREQGVRSPLKEAGLVKEEIRELSRHLGLETWSKPSMACLSSRFPYDTTIDEEGLQRVERAEAYLRAMGFSQLRVRHHGRTARIEVEAADIERIASPEIRGAVVKRLKDLGYSYVAVDLSGYRTGSMNEPLAAEDSDPDEPD